QGDAATTEWWDGTPFDRILLDAPCSASGVIRRNPDIKQLRRSEDIPSLVQQQSAILENCWGLLRQGGRLLYATCSIFPEENEQQIHTFLQQHPEAVVEPIQLDCGHATGAGHQLLPGECGMDGFYYACLRKPGAP
ncbi:MAG: 16S rRNA (cytosine(967)-C(5))-methyltransferase, partial [Gammaproteobacteria bacterium]|nr:16S rRNA (cytosine(967)-C(5))-methyltransferase [Gammaproteobacteria bacterium]